MEQKKSPRIERLPAPVKRAIRSVNFWATLTILAVLLYIFFMMSLSPFSFSCRVCHSKYTESAKKAAHKDLSCWMCHSGFTVSKKLDFRMLLLSMPGYLFFNGTNKITVANETCLVCHRSVIAKTTSGRSGVKMSHLEPIRDGYSCSGCHLPESHMLKEMETGFVDMMSCFECHNGIKASNKCDTCHKDKTYRVDKNRYGYYTTYKQIHTVYKDHGRNPLRTCSNCHSMSYCATCHVMITKLAVALPHPGDWVGLHGQYTNRQNVQACYACHKKSYCFDCHGVEMPHPENYLGRHTREAGSMKSMNEKCLKCHEKENCDYCHTNHRHPGVPGDLLKQLRRLAGFE